MVAKRNPRLDLLRFGAIALVLGSHFMGLAGPVSGFLGETLRVWERGGWIGVDLFFVLSGFLVGNLLLEEYRGTGGVRVGRFLVRRGFKIYPSFYFFTAFATLVFLAEGQFSWPRFLSEVFFLQNYCLGFWVLPTGVPLSAGQLPVGLIDQAQWSLAVEEHFYFLLGLLVFALVRWRRIHLFASIAVGIALACLLLRLEYSLDYPVRGFGPLSTWTHFRLDSLFFGSLLAYAYGFHRAAFERVVRRYWWALMAIATAGFLPFFLIEHNANAWLNTYGLTLLYLSSGCLLLVMLEARAVSIPARVAAPLVFLGRYSYGIYLWHLMVRYLTWRWGSVLWGPDPLPLLPIVCYLGLSVILGVAASVLVELPFLRLRERLVP